MSRRIGRSRTTLGVCVVISVTALTLDYRGSGVVDGVRGTALDALAPLRDATASATRPFTDGWNGLTGYDELRADNARLRDEVADLRRQLTETEGREARYDELLELLDVGDVAHLDLLAARVVSPSPSNFDRTVEIDHGADDGVAEGQAVVAGGGVLVGRVVQVGRTRAVVRLTSDPSFRVGVVLPASGDRNTLRGAGLGEDLVVERVEARSRVNVGDVVRTSGGPDSGFPPDLLIGRVSRVERSPGAVALGVSVTPAAQADVLSFVQVVRWTPSS